MLAHPPIPPERLIDGRTTRHEGDEIRQRKRTLVEDGFGWGQTIGGPRTPQHRGRETVAWAFRCTNAAYHLVRTAHAARLTPPFELVQRENIEHFAHTSAFVSTLLIHCAPSSCREPTAPTAARFQQSKRIGPPLRPSMTPLSRKSPKNPPTTTEVLDAVDRMTPEELDHVPYGMIQLDATGRILTYNAVESKLASLTREEAIGKQFFTEIAPCTKVQDFYGRFKEGVIRESLDTTFRFHFAFKQNPRDVTVRLIYSRRTRTVWVLVADHDG